jgi:N4-gp56 family major capsid protein
MATTTTSVVPNAQAFYNRTMLERAQPAEVHGRFGQTRPIPKNNGNQAKFRRYSQLTPATTALTEGVTPAGSSLSVTDLTATLAQYGDFVTLSDMIQLTTLDPLLTETAEILGDQAGTTIDQVRRDVLVAGTSVAYSNGANRAAVNTILSAGLLKQAVRALKRQNAKKMKQAMAANGNIATQGLRASFVGIIHPDTEATLKSITGYVPLNAYPSQMAIMEDEVGYFDEIRFVSSTNAKVFANGGATGGSNVISTGGSNADVYATLLFGMDAYGIVPLSGESLRNIVKPLGSAGSADPLDQRSTSGWKATTTTLILNDSWMMRLEHANTNTLS